MASSLIRGKYVVCKVAGRAGAEVIADGAVFQRDGAIVVVGRQMMNMNLTFLGMAMIGVVGYLLDVGFALLQKRVLWWRSAARF